MAQASAKDLQSSLRKLQISKDSFKPASKNTKNEPADSWEDEADEESDQDPLPDNEDSSTSTPSSSTPAPPPPTPISPTYGKPPHERNPIFTPDGSTFTPPSSSRTPSSGTRTPTDPNKRPEKTTSVASRLIAAGIGQAPPKRSKEQREYDQAMKVQEKKRRDAERVEEERRRQEGERAKAEAWGD